MVREHTGRVGSLWAAVVLHVAECVLRRGPSASRNFFAVHDGGDLTKGWRLLNVSEALHPQLGDTYPSECMTIRYFEPYYYLIFGSCKMVMLSRFVALPVSLTRTASVVPDWQVQSHNESRSSWGPDYFAHMVQLVSRSRDLRVRRHDAGTWVAFLRECQQRLLRTGVGAVAGAAGDAGRPVAQSLQGSEGWIPPDGGQRERAKEHERYQRVRSGRKHAQSIVLAPPSSSDHLVSLFRLLYGLCFAACGFV